TCYCAIDPRRRREYIDVVATILKPGGWFLGCFFPVRRGGGGPPVPVAKAEVRGLPPPRFPLEWAAPPPRPGDPPPGPAWPVTAPGDAAGGPGVDGSGSEGVLT